MIPFELVSANSILLQNRPYGLFILLLQPHFTMRHRSIYDDYLLGFNTESLADKYCLSDKSIQRIIRMMKSESNT